MAKGEQAMGLNPLETVGQQTRRAALEKDPKDPYYDATRELRDDEIRCPDCGYISRDGTIAERAHDNLCDYIPGE